MQLRQFLFKENFTKRVVFLGAATLSVLIIINIGYLVNFAVEMLFVQKKDITEGQINEFYVGMDRFSVIQVLKISPPSSVDVITDQVFNISSENSNDWKVIGPNSDFGVMFTSGGELLVKLNREKVYEIKCLGSAGRLCGTIHTNDSSASLKETIKEEFKRGHAVRVFPIVFQKPKFLSISDLEGENYRSISAYNGWEIRYRLTGEGEDIYNLFFLNDKIVRIRYEHPRINIGE